MLFLQPLSQCQWYCCISFLNGGTSSDKYHMFKLLIIALIASVTTFCLASGPVKVDKAIICYPIKQFHKEIKKYGEEPMVMGVEGTMEDVGMALYINKETGSYTVVEFDTEAACILSIGTNVRYRFPKFAPNT